MPTIHVYLPEEAVDCQIPVQAEHIAGDVYQILDKAPDDPVREVRDGDFVRCRLRIFVESSRRHEGLAAFERANSTLSRDPGDGLWLVYVGLINPRTVAVLRLECDHGAGLAAQPLCLGRTGAAAHGPPHRQVAGPLLIRIAVYKRALP